jgi:alpha-amylase
MNGLYEVLHKYETAFPVSAYRMYFTSNHDENSWNGTEYEKYGDMAKSMAVFSFTYNSIPLIYSGQEMPNLKRLKFFDKDAIEWSGKYDLHDLYKALIRLRKRNPAIRAADPAATTAKINTSVANNIMAYRKKNGNNEVLVFLNLSKERQEFKLVDKDIDGEYTELFCRSQARLNEGSVIQLQPWNFLVYEK